MPKPTYPKFSLDLSSEVEERQESLNRIAHDRRKDGPGHEGLEDIVRSVRRYMAKADVERLALISP